MQPETPPPSLDYQQPRPAVHWFTLLWQSIVGLIGGTVVAIVFWANMWPRLRSDQVRLVTLIVIAAQVVLGAALARRAKHRGFGIGMLLSVATGLLVVMMFMIDAGLKNAK